MSKSARTVEACLAGLPRTIKLGPYDWSVAVIEGDSDDCAQATFHDHHFRLWPANLNSPGHVVGVVLHECLHVIYDAQGLSKAKRDREETIVLGFEAGLTALFRDNRKL